MKDKLKKSSKSSNFWASLSTVVASIFTGLYIMMEKNPDGIHNIAVPQLVNMIIYQIGHSLYKMNQD